VRAALALRWEGPAAPGDWTRVVRRFRDGHEEVWWAAEATLGPWGPDGRHRLVVATTDPATLPALSTWYLLTNLPRPGSPCAAASPLAPADLPEVVRLYGLRLWVENRQPYHPCTTPGVLWGAWLGVLSLHRRTGAGGSGRRLGTPPVVRLLT
jgi:hypothetical protein